jgi:DnaJ-class molecular chaperone
VLGSEVEVQTLKGKVEVPVLKLDKSKLRHPSLTASSILLTQVKLAVKEQFAEYLEKGGLCYDFKRLTPEYVTCDVCRGSGRVYNNTGRNNNNTVPEYSICAKCNGTGKMKPTLIQYSKDKILINQ